MNQMTRRDFIVSATPRARRRGWARKKKPAPSPASATGLDFPLVDFHVHLDHSTIDAALALPQARDVKFGIVEHAGTKENKYPFVISNDNDTQTPTRHARRQAGLSRRAGGVD